MMTELPVAESTTAAIGAHVEWRRRSCLNLIASHSLMSSGARAVLASGIADRRTAGAIGRRVHSGSRFLDEMERICVDHLKPLFRSRYCEYRAPTCAVLNSVVMRAMTEPGDRVIAPARRYGGDSSVRGSSPIVQGRYDVYDLPYDEDAWDIDIYALERLADCVHPSVIVLGTSMPLTFPPVAEICDLARRHDAAVMIDGAHLLGWIASGYMPSPLNDGALALTGSTQKTLFGPVGSLFFTNNATLAELVSDSLDEIIQSYDMSILPATVVSFADRSECDSGFFGRVVDNARSLGNALSGQGLNVVRDGAGFTDTHEVLLKFSARSDRDSAFARLTDANILCTPTGGVELNLLRFGLLELTCLGFERSEIFSVGEVVGAAVQGHAGSTALRALTEDLAGRHNDDR